MAFANGTPVLALRPIWSRFWPDARRFRGRLLLSIVVMAALPALQTAEIWLFQRVVDDVLVPGDASAFAGIAGLYVVLGLASGVLSYADAYLAASVGQRFVLVLRRRLFDHLLKLSPGALGRRPRGDVLARLSGDVGEVERLVLSGVGQGLSAAVQVAFFAGALFLLDPLLAAASLLVAPAFAMAARTLTRLIKDAARQQRHRAGSLNAVADRAMADLALIQSCNGQALTAARFEREGQAKLAADLATSRYRALLQPLINVVELVGVLVVLGLGAWALGTDRLTLGQLLSFMAFLTQLYGPVRTLADLSGTLSSASAGAERIVELLDQEPEVSDRPEAMALARVGGRVELDRVSFRYPGAAAPALRDITLTLEPGETVALVGASGAGKSTLAKLLVRFHDPCEGALRIDGHDYRDVRLASLRDQITLLDQDAAVTGATVGEAIAFGCPGATAADMAEAARAAGCDRFVADLPFGYDTPLAEGGVSLSGGQRQRLALARAILRDAPVVVLDEPTSALDATATRVVVDAVDRLARDRTVVVISHQLLTVGRADRIIVLDHGRVMEQGNHEKLVASGGLYARQWRLSRAVEAA